MKYFLFAVLTGFTLNCFGQNSAGMPSGNIGIGSGTTAPAFPLHIKSSNGYLINFEGTGNFSGFNMVNATSGKYLGIHYTTDGTANIATNSLRFGRYSSSGWESNPVLFDMDAPEGSFVLSQEGKVGVGTLHPEFKLDVTVSDAFDGILLRKNNSGWLRMHPNTLGQSAYNTITKAGDAGIIFGEGTGPGDLNFGFVLAPWSNSLSGLRMDKFGRVGIGTFNTSDGNFNLFVENGIRTRKVKVDQASWADFVFSPSYKLRPLNEVKSFINEHHHLPDVPSEKEVLQNGHDLGDMNKILLQKIEELTLYAIEQDDVNKKQNDLIQEQTVKINQLESLLEKLSSRLSKLEQKQ